MINHLLDCTQKLRLTIWTLRWYQCCALDVNVNCSSDCTQLTMFWVHFQIVASQWVKTKFFLFCNTFHSIHIICKVTYSVNINKGNPISIITKFNFVYIIHKLVMKYTSIHNSYSNNNEAIHVSVSRSVTKLCSTSPSTVAVLRCVVNWIVRELFDGSATQFLTVQWRQWKQFW